MDNTHQKHAPSNKSTRPFHPPTTVPTPAPPTHATQQALLPFGLLPVHNQSPRSISTPSSKLLQDISSDQLTLITGRSGSGKSTLLKALQPSLTKTNTIITHNNLQAPTPSRPIFDLFDTPTPTNATTTASLLSSAGLAEPKLWALPASALSTGQHARLDLARLFHLATNQPSPIIILDEYASNLDRLTARSMSASLKTFLTRHPGIKVIAAGAHEDLPTILDTNLIIDASNYATLPSVFTPEHITIEPGSPKDYHTLKHHHYLAADPASIVRIDRAMRTCPITRTRILAGVLVVAYPTLNAAWRDRAWPNRYTTNNKSHNAKKINSELRRLARIIVAPHSRGLSISTSLVKNYLRNPLTQATESLAAMGSTNPFLKRAGMTEYPVPHSPTSLRLLDALDHLNLRPQDLLSHNEFPPLLKRELTTWARAQSFNPDDPNLPQYAAFRLLTAPRAYTHVHKE